MKKLIVFIIPLFLFLTGCEKNPVGALLYSDPNNSTEWADTFIIYDDIMKTRGKFDPWMFTNWVEKGAGTLDFLCTEKVYKGTKSIKMTWDGGESTPNPSGVPQFVWVGFGMPAKGFYESKPPVPPFSGYDISAGGYTKIELYVSGNLRHNVQLEIKAAIDINENAAGVEFFTIPNDGQWHKLEVPFTNPSSLTKVKGMFAVTMTLINKLQKSNGAEIYIDEIRFVK